MVEDDDVDAFEFGDVRSKRAARMASRVHEREERLEKQARIRSIALWAVALGRMCIALHNACKHASEVGHVDAGGLEACEDVRAACLAHVERVASHHRRWLLPVMHERLNDVALEAGCKEMCAILSL